MFLTRRPDEIKCALKPLRGIRNGPRELDSVVSEIFLGFQAAKSR